VAGARAGFVAQQHHKFIGWGRRAPAPLPRVKIMRLPPAGTDLCLLIGLVAWKMQHAILVQHWGLAAWEHERSMRTVKSRDLPRGGQRVMASPTQTPAQARSWWRQHTGQARGSDATGTLRERDGGQGRRSIMDEEQSIFANLLVCYPPPHRSTEVPHRLQRSII
jgi:hypothetical protein